MYNENDGPGAKFLTVDGFEDVGPCLRVFQAGRTEIMPEARHDNQAWCGICGRSVHQVWQEQDAQQCSGQIINLQPSAKNTKGGGKITRKESKKKTKK